MKDMNYMGILDIINKIPDYNYGTKNLNKRQIKEFLSELEYDEDFIDEINDDFSKGFGCAKEIIKNLISKNYWEQQKLKTNKFKETITLPNYMVGSSKFYILISLNDELIKIYKKNSNIESVKNNTAFILIDKIHCSTRNNTANNHCQLPLGIFEISGVSRKHQELNLDLCSDSLSVKTYGYIEVFEDFYIFSNLYVGDDVNINNFIKKTENIVQNIEKNILESTINYIKVEDQNKFDEIMEYISPGDLINIY